MTTQDDKSVSVHDLIAAFDDSDEEEVDIQEHEAKVATEIAESTSTSNNEVVTFFQSASGKKSTVKKKNLEREMALEGDEEHLSAQKPNEVASLFTSASGNKVNVNRDRLRQVEESMADEDSGAVVSLFQTASNNKIVVNEKALQLAEAAYGDDEEVSTASPEQKPSAIVASLFQTASNKKVDLKKDALQRAEAAYQDEEYQLTTSPEQNHPSTVASLFQTASNKQLEVQKSNLEKAESMMDTDENDQRLPVPKPFTPPIQAPSSVQKSSDLERQTPTRKRKRPISESSARKKSKFSQYHKDSPTSNSPATVTPRKLVSRTPKSSVKKSGAKQFKSPRLHNSTMTVQAADNASAPIETTGVITKEIIQPLVGPSWLPQPKPAKERVYISDFVSKQPQSSDRSASSSLPDEIVYLTSESATTFLFETKQLDSNFTSLLEESLGTEKPLPLRLTHEHFQKILVHLGAKVDVISPKWVQNHYRWIVWKCGCTQRRYPHLFPNYLSPNTILSQLIYRYNCEYTRGQRSILKKIFETDAADSIHMVLTVASTNMLTDVSTVKMPNPNAPSPVAVIEVTDGWYSCNMGLDETLSRYVNWGKIKEGIKLRVCNGQLVGTESSCSPLDAPELSFINYTVNSVRRARWDKPLGMQMPPSGFKVNIASLQLNGGVVPQVEGIVQKRYPLLFMERIELPNNQVRRISRSASAEEQAAQQHQQDLQNFVESQMDQLVSKMNREGLEQLRDELSCVPPHEIQDVDLLLTMAELGEFNLTDEQNGILQHHAPNIQFRRAEEVKKDLQTLMLAQGLSTERKVTPYFTVLMKDSCSYTRKIQKSPNFERDGGRLFKVTVWLASEELFDRFVEGRHLRISGLDISQSGSDAMLNLKSTNMTATEELPCTEADKQRVGFTERKCILIGDLENSVISREEFDTVGHVMYVSEQTRAQRFLQTKVYVADVRSSQILLIKLLDTETRVSGWTPLCGQSYAFENLTYSHFDKKNHLHVCTARLESVCTDIPRLPHLSAALHAFITEAESQGIHLRNMQTRVETLLQSDPSNLNSKKFLQTTLSTQTHAADEQRETIVGNLVMNERQVATVHIAWDAQNSQDKLTDETSTTSRFSFPIPSSVFDRPEELCCNMKSTASPMAAPRIHNSSSSVVEEDEMQVSSPGTEAAPILVDDTPEKEHTLLLAGSSITFHLEAHLNQGDSSRRITLSSKIFSELIQDLYRKCVEEKGQCEWISDFIQYGTVPSKEEDPWRDDTLSSLIAAHRQYQWTSKNQLGDVFLSALTEACILDRSQMDTDAARALSTVEEFQAHVHSRIQLTAYQEAACKQHIYFFDDEWESLVNHFCSLLEEPMLSVVFAKENPEEISSVEVTAFESIQELYDMMEDE